MLYQVQVWVTMLEWVPVLLEMLEQIWFGEGDFSTGSAQLLMDG